MPANTGAVTYFIESFSTHTCICVDVYVYLCMYMYPLKYMCLCVSFCICICMCSHAENSQKLTSTAGTPDYSKEHASQCAPKNSQIRQEPHGAVSFPSADAKVLRSPTGRGVDAQDAFLYPVSSVDIALQHFAHVQVLESLAWI